MDNKLISIIVPVYNSEKYLKECLESLVHQDYKNIEILLIDDGSSDLSGRICDDYESMYDTIRVIHTYNGGVSRARNIGINNSKGAFITFVDSDDIVSINYCSELIKAMDETTDFVIARTISFINDDLSNKIDDGFRGNYVDEYIKTIEKEELIKSIFIDNKQIIKIPHVSTCSAKLIRKTLIMNNLLNYDVNMHIYEDAYFNTEVILHSNKVKTIDKKIYFYRMNNSSSSNKFNENIFSEYEYVYKKFNQLSQRYDFAFMAYLPYFRIKNLNTILTNYFKINNYNKNFIKNLLKDYLNDFKKLNISVLPKKRKVLKIFSQFNLYYLIYLLYRKR